MTRDEAYQAINEILAKSHPAPVTAATPLRELDLDSLGLVELIFALEERFDIELPFNANDFAGGKGAEATVGDLVDRAIADPAAHD